MAPLDCRSHNAAITSPGESSLKLQAPSQDEPVEQPRNRGQPCATAGHAGTLGAGTSSPASTMNWPTGRAGRRGLAAAAAYVLIGLVWLSAGGLWHGRFTAVGLLAILSFLLVGAAALVVLLRRPAHERALAAAERAGLEEAAPGGLALTDADGLVRDANQAFHTLLAAVVPEGQPLTIDAVAAAALPEGNALRPETGAVELVLHLPQSRRIALRSVRLAAPAAGWALGAADATAAEGSRETVRIHERIFAIAADGIVISDMRRPGEPAVAVNPAFEEITGYSAAEALGRNCRYLQANDRNQPELAAVRDAVAKGEPVSVTLRNYRKSGAMFWNQLTLAPVRDAAGALTHYVGIMRDVTEHTQLAVALERQTGTDALTGLDNRTRFIERLGEILEAPDTEFVLVAIVDMQNFNDITATGGFEMADALLELVARRLTRMAPEALIGRIGGDEFALAVAIADEYAADQVLGPVRAALAERFVLPGFTFDARFAAGYVVAEHAGDAGVLVRQAMVALHEAREAGPEEARRFEPSIEAMIRGRMRLTGEMHQAVANGDFLLHYQPKVHLPTGRVVGAEALLRWRHPLFGMQPPARFIAAAEQSSLIRDLGEIALKKAARFAVAVNRDREVPLEISIKVSQVQFRGRGFSQVLQRLVLESGADPSWLTLELTETVFAAPSGEFAAGLRRLRNMGFGISIDDFGTGYSSLRYLRSFPMTEIKVDRGFVQNIELNAYNQAIMEAILKVGAALDVTVTAEGIESVAERDMLLALGCQIGQGFLLSHPLEETDFLALVRAGGVLPPATGRDAA